MSSQTSLATRRQFLERSMLGFGSAFLLPSLLASCTDHIVPPVNPRIFPKVIPPALPLLGDYDFDWNDAAKSTVVAGLELVPEVGEILGPLVDIFWPSTKEDVWGEIRSQVELLVDQKLDDNQYKIVTGRLTGLNNVAGNYVNAIKDNGDIAGVWRDLRDDFAQYQPDFQTSGYELLLLPLFAQFANMYLAVLRDAALFGKNWGMKDGDVQQAATDITTYIKSFTDYTTNVYNVGRYALQQKTKPDPHQCEPFRTVNQFDRQMHLTVLDFMESWPYYDVIKYPNGGGDALTKREIYSDPYGTCDDSGNIVIASHATHLPTQLTVWGADRINAVQLTYPAGTGPGGVTQTKRMGAGGGSNQPPQGNILTLAPDAPITWVRATYGSIVNSMQFYDDKGNYTDEFGGGYVDPYNKPNETGWLSYNYQALSSIHINGVSSFYASADCVVFGFQFWKTPDATVRAIQAIYVRSPKERSAADFARALPKHNIPANLITDELKAKRKAYWEYMKTR